jgi:hypothetical protein
MSQPCADDLDARAVQAVRDALAVARRYPLAEVQLVVSSDRAGCVHLRSEVRVTLPALLGGVESCGGAT